MSELSITTNIAKIVHKKLPDQQITDKVRKMFKDVTPEKPCITIPLEIVCPTSSVFKLKIAENMTKSGQFVGLILGLIM